MEVSREVLGLITIVSALCGYVFYLHRRFEKERDSYAMEREKRNAEWLGVAKESNQAQRENTNVLAGLKALLESKNHNK